MTQGSDTASSVAFIGDFTQVWIGLRQGIRIEASRDEKFSEVAIQVRATARVDVGLIRANHIAKLVGIKA